MTDKQVEQAIKNGSGNPNKKIDMSEKAEKKTKTKKDDDSPNTSDMSISSMSEEESSTTEDEPPIKIRPDTTKKAGSPVMKVRPEFPKTNIRRWMTPGTRFDTPPNLLSEDMIKMNRQKQIPCQQDITQCFLEQKKSLEERKAKLETKCEGSQDEKPKDLPVPVHRRRTKSWRHLTFIVGRTLAIYQPSLIDLSIFWITIIKKYYSARALKSFDFPR